MDQYPSMGEHRQMEEYWKEDILYRSCWKL